MKKLALLLIIPFALLMGIQSASAQQEPAATAGTHTMKTSSQRPAAASNLWNGFKPETLSGTISLVKPGKKSVFVTGSGGVSYAFVVTRETKIHINGTSSTIANLAQQGQKQATVTFIARPNGDFAQSIMASS